MTVIRKQEKEEEEREENWGEGKGPRLWLNAPLLLPSEAWMITPPPSPPPPSFLPFAYTVLDDRARPRKNGVGFARYYYILPVAAFLLA